MCVKGDAYIFVTYTSESKDLPSATKQLPQADVLRSTHEMGKPGTPRPSPGTAQPPCLTGMCHWILTASSHRQCTYNPPPPFLHLCHPFIRPITIPSLKKVLENYVLLTYELLV